MVDITALINQVTLTAAIAVVIAGQILKSKLIPVPFQNAPVPTTIVISIVATWIALVNQHFVLAWGSVSQVIGTFVVVFGTAVVVYNNSIRNWPAARSLEAPKDTK